MTDGGGTTGSGVPAGTVAATISGAGTMAAVAGALIEAGATDDICGRAAGAFASPAHFVASFSAGSGSEKPLRTAANAAGGTSLSSGGAGVTRVVAATSLSRVWLSLFCFVRGCVRVKDAGTAPHGSTPDGGRPDCGAAPAGVADGMASVGEQGGGAETVTQGGSADGKPKG